MQRAITVLLTVVLLTAGTALLQAQENKEAPTSEKVFFAHWKRVHNKVLAMARDTEFPEEKFNARPHPDARGYQQEIWHITAILQWRTYAAKGEKTPKGLFSDEGRPTDRAGMVAELEAAIEESYKVLENNFDPANIRWLEGSGEHYGKLVTIYRMNGIVPPSSRK